MLTNTKLNDVNLMCAINAKVIPVAAYPMNVCKFTSGELNELDQVIKRELRSKKMLGKQASDERLYLKREDGGVACYMACSENRWISAAWRREKYKDENSIVEEATKTMENIGVGIQFEEGGIRIDGEQIDGGWKPAWRRMKEKLKGRRKNKRIEEYSIKEQQSRLYKEQEKECHIWLAQNLNPGKTASIMTMMEQMVETRSWKEARGLVEDGNCTICRNFS